MEFNVLIKNGKLADGSGNPCYKADIAIKGDKIVQINERIDPADAKEVIDADNRVVAPGFIDVHSHDDFFIPFKPTADEKVLQGITCVINGNCGGSAGPVLPDSKFDIKGVLFPMMGGSFLPEGFLEYSTFGEYLKKLEELEPGINVASLVGHAIVRSHVMGMADQTPDEKQLEKMKSITLQAMQEGAFGLSTGLAYAPGSFADTEEIIELCKVVAAQGGIYATHMRNESNRIVEAVAEALRIGEEAKVRIQISHHKAMGRENWSKSLKTIELMEEARKKGVRVACDQYPYTAANTYLPAVLPPQYLQEGYDILAEKLKQKDFREDIQNQIETHAGEGWENFIKNAGFENLQISSSPNHPEYISKSIEEIAKSRGISGYDLVFDLISEEKSETYIIMYVMDEEDLVRILQNSFTMIGSDGFHTFGKGKSHPRFSGTFPRVLGRYVRKKNILDMEEAIRKMTSLPALTFGITNKGLLAKGYDADIVIFDPSKVIDRATYEEPDLPPEGIDYVLVNGRMAVKNGKVTGSRSGKVLRHRL